MGDPGPAETQTPEDVPAAVLAFFLVPVVSWLERRGLARWLSAILVVVAMVFAIVAVGLLIAVTILNQGQDFIENLPAICAELESWYL